MTATADYDAAVEQVVLGHRFASEDEIQAARALRDADHPGKDLGEALFMKGILSRERLALVRRLVRMDRRGNSARVARRNQTPRGSGSSKRPKSSAALRDASPSAESARPAPTPEKGEPGSESETRVMEARPRASGSKTLGPLSRCGRYELVERVARGGMGVIYRARHPDLERDFAVKVLSDGGDAGEEAIARFRREAKAAAKLNHPGIVRVYDCGSEDGYPYLVMDFVEGRSLEEVVREEGLTPERAAQVAMTLADALHHAHKQGLVHRDVKPSNVLVDEDGDCRITDFGIVKEVTADAKLTRTGFTLGSPCYMSPEQAAGEHDRIGPGSDVYSLGATLYEMLTGEPPFQGESIHQIMRKVIDEEPVPPSRKVAVPFELECICLKALDKEPEGRYLSARAMGLDLQAFLAGEPIAARPAGWWTIFKRRARRNRLVVALSGLLVLTVLGFFGTLMTLRVVESSRRATEAERRCEEALGLLSSIPPDESRALVRRRYSRAITLYSEALLLTPGDEDIRAARQALIVEFGDELLESGLTEFAEFVYQQHEGYREDPELAEKVKLARDARWVTKAQEKIQEHDLRAAIAIYEAGVLQLKQSGYDTRVFEEKVAKLKEMEQAQSRQARREALLAAARQKQRDQDLVGALEDLLQAQRLGDPQGMIEEDVARLSEQLAARVAELEKRVSLERERFVALRSEGPFASGLRAEVDGALSGGDRALADARRAAAEREFRAGLKSLAQALESFSTGGALAAAARARDALDGPRASATEAEAERFAAEEYTKAQTLERQGQERFDLKDYAGAAEAWEAARARYSLAKTLSLDKGGVAELRKQARGLREEAFELLPPGVTVRDYEKACALEERARESFAAGSLTVAEEQYGEACKLFAAVKKIAPLVAKAHDERAQALELKDQADDFWGALYGGDFYVRGIEVLREGEAELGLEHFEVAADRFDSACFRFKRAIDKARTTALARKSAEVAQGRMTEARERCLKASRTENTAFLRAEKERDEGLRATSRGYWSGAEKKFDDATKAYLEALGLR